MYSKTKMKKLEDACRQSLIPHVVIPSTWATIALNFKLFSSLLSLDFQDSFSVLGPNSWFYIFCPPGLQMGYFLEPTYPLGSFCHYSAASEDVLCSKQNTFHLS